DLPPTEDPATILSQAGAAVDRDAGAGEIRLFAEKAHRARDIGGRPDAPERDLLELLGATRFVPVVGKDDGARRDAVDARRGRELDGETARQMQERRLRRGVGGPVGP